VYSDEGMRELESIPVITKESNLNPAASPFVPNIVDDKPLDASLPEDDHAHTQETTSAAVVVPAAPEPEPVLPEDTSPFAETNLDPPEGVISLIEEDADNTTPPIPDRSTGSETTGSGCVTCPPERLISDPAWSQICDPASSHATPDNQTVVFYAWFGD